MHLGWPMFNPINMVARQVANKGVLSVSTHLGMMHFGQNVMLHQPAWFTNNDQHSLLQKWVAQNVVMSAKKVLHYVKKLHR